MPETMLKACPKHAATHTDRICIAMPPTRPVPTRPIYKTSQPKHTRLYAPTRQSAGGVLT